jgi:hypothetical protein
MISRIDDYTVIGVCYTAEVFPRKQAGNGAKAGPPGRAAERI